MKELKIFLGTNERPSNNKDALTITAMKEKMDCLEDINYSLVEGKSILMDKREKFASLLEAIKSSDICILDGTSLFEDAPYVEYITNLFKMCVQLEKPLILIYHKDYPIDSWIDYVDEDKLLGAYPHFGKSLPGDVISCIKRYVENNPEYKSTQMIVLDEENIDSFADCFTALSSLQVIYLHIFLYAERIIFGYQIVDGRNLTLNFDFSKLKEEDKKQIIEGFKLRSERYPNCDIHDLTGMEPIQKTMK